jgi:outer membrane protein assembly factor BamB
MKSKKIYLLIILAFFSILITACSSGAYASTSWHGLTADSDAAYLAAGTQVYKIDVNNGSEMWRYPEKPNAKGFYANPVITSDGQLLVPSYDNKLYSLDPTTNAEKWNFAGSHNRLIASPLVSNETIFQPSSDGYIYALDMNGKLRWEKEIGEPLWAQPAAAPECGCIYLAAMDHTVYSLDESTGDLIWQSPELGGALVGTPAVSPEGVLYVGTFGNELIALDATTGSILWRYSTEDWIWSGPVLADNVLYFGDLSGFFYALDATDHSLLWRIQPQNSILDKPVILDDNIYLTTEGDTLFIINKSDGKVVDSRVIGGLIYSSPVMSGETILIAPTSQSKTDAILYALNPDGSQKWTPFTPAK